MDSLKWTKSSPDVMGQSNRQDQRTNEQTSRTRTKNAQAVTQKDHKQGLDTLFLPFKVKWLARWSEPVQTLQVVMGKSNHLQLRGLPYEASAWQLLEVPDAAASIQRVLLYQTASILRYLLKYDLTNSFLYWSNQQEGEPCSLDTPDERSLGSQ